MGEEVEEWGGAACKGSEEPGTDSGWLVGLQGGSVSSSYASVGTATAYMRLVEAGSSSELMDGRSLLFVGTWE
jgi:hypothetical protein